MKQLELADLRHLTAADGWVGLGDLVSASDELEETTPENRGHPAVLTVRYEIYAKAKKREMAAEVANALTRTTPESPASWICLAYSIRRKSGGGIPPAKEILVGAEPNFPKEFLFPYNLACYCSQLSQFAEAQGGGSRNGRLVGWTSDSLRRSWNKIHKNCGWRVSQSCAQVGRDGRRLGR